MPREPEPSPSTFSFQGQSLHCTPEVGCALEEELSLDLSEKSICDDHSLDRIPVAVQDEHQMLSVRSKLQLEVLLLVVEEESLDNLVLPKFKICFTGFPTLGCWIAKEGCFYLDDEVPTVSFKVDLHRFVVETASP